MTRSLIYLCGEHTPINAYDVKFGTSPKIERIPVDVSRFEEVERIVDIADEEGRALVNIVALAVTPDGRVFYHYRVSRDMAFNFDLRSCVGEPWQNDFARIIADNHLQIVTRDIDERPWIYDAIAGSEAAQHGKEA